MDLFSSLERTTADFQTTNWSIVGGLRASDGQVRRQTAEWLAREYWPPVYASARRLTKTREEAAELTQAFFAEVVLGRGLLDLADEGKGRLRSLICTALRRFAVDQWRHNKARGAGRLVPLNGLEREDALLQDSSPEEEFDRRWALKVFERAIKLCERHYMSAGMADHWRLFEDRIIHPALRQCDAPPVADLAKRHGFDSVRRASAALQTVKRKLTVTIRQVVAETVTDLEQAEQERAYLMKRLGMSAPTGANDH